MKKSSKDKLNSNIKHMQYVLFSVPICPNDLNSSGIYATQTSYRPSYATRLNIDNVNNQCGAACILYTDGHLEYNYAKVSNSVWQDLFPNEPVIYLNSLKGTRSASDNFFWITVSGWIEI